MEDVNNMLAFNVLGSVAKYQKNFSRLTDKVLWFLRLCIANKNFPRTRGEGRNRGKRAKIL